MVLRSLLMGTGSTGPNDRDFEEYFNNLKLIVPEIFKRKAVTPNSQLLAHASMSRALQLMFYRLSKYACPKGRNLQEKEMIELIEESQTDYFQVPEPYIKHVYCSCLSSSDTSPDTSPNCSTDENCAESSDVEPIINSRPILAAKRRLALKSFEPDGTTKPMTDEEVAEIGSSHLSTINSDYSDDHELEVHLDQDCYNCGIFCTCTGTIKVHTLDVQETSNINLPEVLLPLDNSNEDGDLDSEIIHPDCDIDILDVIPVALDLLILPYHDKVQLKSSKREFTYNGTHRNLTIQSRDGCRIFEGSPYLLVSFLSYLKEQNRGVKFKMRQIIELMRIYEWWRETYHIFEFHLESAALSNVPLSWNKHFFMMDVHYPSYICE